MQKQQGAWESNKARDLKAQSAIPERHKKVAPSFDRNQLVPDTGLNNLELIHLYTYRSNMLSGAVNKGIDNLLGIIVKLTIASQVHE